MSAKTRKTMLSFEYIVSIITNNIITRHRGEEVGEREDPEGALQPHAEEDDDREEKRGERSQRCLRGKENVYEHEYISDICMYICM